MLDRYVFKGNQKLRCGYTTGSCAAAASKAATSMLLSGKRLDTVPLMTPKGVLLTLTVLEPEIEENRVQCAIQKDAGDDADVTDGILVYACVEKAKERQEEQVVIKGGIGVGAVTKKGLTQKIGEPAINPVPLQMIQNEVRTVLEEWEYDGTVVVTISIPAGVEIAKKTFNQRLGIEGGISILGTSGIVEPMSEAAIVETIRAEMRMLAAAGQQDVILTPGNYGEQFASKQLGLDLSQAVKCSNFIGETIDMAYEFKLTGLLLIGHIGKLVKLGSGIMNTHSKWADGRMEAMVTAALFAGAGVPTLKKIATCLTTEETIEYLIEENILKETMAELGKKVEIHLEHRAYQGLEIGAILFSNQHGILVKTSKADSIQQRLLAGKN